MTYKFRGLRELDRKFKYELSKIDKGTTEGLTRAANTLLELSQPLVPVDTGRLKRSGKVTITGDYSRTVSYYAENPTTGYDYAPLQHEATWFRHKPGQMAKFLEIPYRQNIKKLVEIVGDTIKEEAF